MSLCYSAASAVSPSGPPAVRIEGDQLRVRFDRFDQAAYGLFLKVKRLPEYRLEFIPHGEAYEISAPSRFAAMLGVERPVAPACALPLWPKLYDDQVEIVTTALAAKRYACWSDCGLGKTFIAAEFARQVVHATGGRFLQFTLLEIIPQWLEMVQWFYDGALPLAVLGSREHMREWCQHGTVDGRETEAKIALTNYEKLNHKGSADQVVSEMRHLAGVGADESDRLATGGGKQKWALIKSSKGVPYKLSLTATPAPNEIMEFASQASFLETMRSDNEIIWTFFRRDETTHRWTVKRHARKAFFEFMAGWSIYVRDPRRYGWRKGIPDVPAPEIIERIIEPTAEQRELAAAMNRDESGGAALFRMSGVNTIQRMKLGQAAKGFVYQKGKPRVRRVESLKPGIVADLVQQDAQAGLQVLVWTVFDEEADIIVQELHRRGMGTGEGGVVELLTGQTPKDLRPAIRERFRLGQTRILVTRASVLGYGINMQHCGCMVFSGYSDSYKRFYQALRRAYRQGQTRRLRVHIPYIPLLEGDSWETILRKQADNEAAIAEMEENYIRARQQVLGRAAQSRTA